MKSKTFAFAGKIASERKGECEHPCVNKCLTHTTACKHTRRILTTLKRSYCRPIVLYISLICSRFYISSFSLLVDPALSKSGPTQPHRPMKLKIVSNKKKYFSFLSLSTDNVGCAFMKVNANFVKISSS